MFTTSETADQVLCSASSILFPVFARTPFIFVVPFPQPAPYFPATARSAVTHPSIRAGIITLASVAITLAAVEHAQELTAAAGLAVAVTAVRAGVAVVLNEPDQRPLIGRIVSRGINGWRCRRKCGAHEQYGRQQGMTENTHLGSPEPTPLREVWTSGRKINE
jgi:hypothetical protein